MAADRAATQVAAPAVETQDSPVASFMTAKTHVTEIAAVVRFVTTMVPNLLKNNGRRSSNVAKTFVIQRAAHQNIAAASKASVQACSTPALPVAVVPAVAAPVAAPVVQVATAQIPAVTVTAASNLATQHPQMRTVSTPVLTAVTTA